MIINYVKLTIFDLTRPAEWCGKFFTSLFMWLVIIKHIISRKEITIVVTKCLIITVIIDCRFCNLKTINSLDPISPILILVINYYMPHTIHVVITSVVIFTLNYWFLGVQIKSPIKWFLFISVIRFTHTNDWNRWCWF